MTERDPGLPAGPVLEVGAALASSLQLEEALANVVRKIGEVMKVALVQIWTYSGERQVVTHEAHWSCEGLGSRDASPPGSDAWLDTWPDFSRVIEGKQMVERHVDDADLPTDVRALMEKRGYRSVLDAPLTIAGEVMGILGLVETRSVRRFSDEERRLLGELCRFAAVGVHNATLFRNREERERRLLALLKTSRSMAASMSAQETIQGMRAEIASLVGGVEAVEVFMGLEDGTFEKFASADRVAVPSAEDEEGDVVDPVVARALESKRPVQANLGGRRVRIVIPVVLKNEPTAYIDLCGRLSHKVSSDEIKFLQTLANHTAVAIENARLSRAVERQSATDVVSSVYSRWYFYERLYSEVARAYRYKHPLALVMAEIDDYDAFRKKRGDVDGDAVLRAMGRVFNTILRRKVDVVCRFSAAQFGILMPNTKSAAPGAALAAERLRATIEKTEFRDAEHDILGKFTVSMGVAGYPLHADEGDELLEVATKALAEAKAAGRNKVKIYAPYQMA